MVDFTNPAVGCVCVCRLAVAYIWAMTMAQFSKYRYMFVCLLFCSWLCVYVCLGCVVCVWLVVAGDGIVVYLFALCVFVVCLLVVDSAYHFVAMSFDGVCLVVCVFVCVCFVTVCVCVFVCLL